MSIVYERAGGDVLAMADEVMRAHHPELQLPGGEYPRLCVLMASGAPEGESAVRRHGYPCWAVVSVIPYKQRVDKRADAEIVVDERTWHDLPERRQRALLDHEITHLEVVTDERGCVLTDDMGRPKLRVRPHDWQLGGFRSVARRYGNDAPEVIQAREFEQQHGAVALAGDELFAPPAGLATPSTTKFILGND